MREAVSWDRYQAADRKAGRTDDGNPIGKLLDVLARRVEAVKVVQVRQGGKELFGAAHPGHQYCSTALLLCIYDAS